MISVSQDELNNLLNDATTKTFNRNEIVTPSGVIPNEIIFINKGLVRLSIVDSSGNKHTMHFALENHFIADYSHFILKQPAVKALQAVEKT